MSNNKQKRSSGHTETAQGPTEHQDQHGVGARQPGTAPAWEGGRYPDTCTLLNFPESEKKNAGDLRIKELEEVGLNKTWIRIARAIGYDAFIRMWIILDEPDMHGIYEKKRIWVPMFKTFLKFQRNRQIQTLADNGHQSPYIKKMIEQQTGESLHIVHIQKLMKKSKLSK
jgi:hypothetical protein